MPNIENENFADVSSSEQEMAYSPPPSPHQPPSPQQSSSEEEVEHESVQVEEEAGDHWQQAPTEDESIFPRVREINKRKHVINWRNEINWIKFMCLYCIAVKKEKTYTL